MPDLPIEVRRQNWGWFGDPWRSGICYTDDGQVMPEMRKPFPEGEACYFCEELFQPGDSGMARPYFGTSVAEVRHIHKECGLAEALGSIRNLRVHCSCNGAELGKPLTRRQDALLVWAWVQEHGVRAPIADQRSIK
jgi:hypothetical protein